MAALLRSSAALGLAMAVVLIGCSSADEVGARRSGVIVDPWGPIGPAGMDAGTTLQEATSLASSTPQQAYVDAGRDAECHDACPARCDDDEICCYRTGFCVPLDCWECCPDDDSRAIGHAAAQAP